MLLRELRRYRRMPKRDGHIGQIDQDRHNNQQVAGRVMGMVEPANMLPVCRRFDMRMVVGSRAPVPIPVLLQRFHHVMRHGLARVKHGEAEHQGHEDGDDTTHGVHRLRQRTEA